MTTLTDAAVEAAAKAWRQGGHHAMCAQTNPCNCYFQRYRERARIFLAAAIPHLRKDWEREVLERVVKSVPANGEAPDFLSVLTAAMKETRALLAPEVPK